ncbi:protein yellow-like [Hermetia illucens]|nr:protein yellow-like [Hermetia illucens]
MGTSRGHIRGAIAILVLNYLAAIASGQANPLFPRPESVSPSDRQFRVAYEWNVIDYAYPSEIHRSRALQVGDYIPTNVLISDVKAFANRLYVTMPRMLPGVPATLGWIISPDNNGPTNPRVEPFPNWEMNQRTNCSALQFVQGIAIDADGIMWVVDSGRLDTLRPERPVFTCPPKLLLLDLKRNGTILHRHEFPEEVVARGTNYLNKVVVDDAFGGFAYITDNSGSDPGIVVFSRKLNRSWKVRENNSMRAALNAIQFTVNGTNLQFSIHIDGIALGPYYNPNTGDTLTLNSPKFSNENFERNVYYCPLSSYHLYSIPASFLRDPEFTRRSTPREIFESVTDYGLKVSQTDGMIMDNQGILYYGLLKEHAIAQWDSFQPFTVNNQRIVARDDDFIQWVDGMSFDELGNLFVVVNRLHNFVAGRLNPNEINFRILRSKTGSLSYVYTNSFGAGNIGTDPNSYPHEGAAFFDNGLSSTTPIYNLLEGRIPYYNSAKKNAFVYFHLILMLVFTLALR